MSQLSLREAFASDALSTQLTAGRAAPPLVSFDASPAAVLGSRFSKVEEEQQLYATVRAIELAGRRLPRSALPTSDA